MPNLGPSNAATSDPEPRTSPPPCPHFGPCGGCQLQHLTYPAQLALKAARLRALLDATGLALPELQLHASPPLAYRNRIRLTLAEVAGQLRAGYLTSTAAEASNLEPRTLNLEPRTSNFAFLPITQCPIAAPILWRATEAFLAAINQRAAIWRERAPFTLDQLELFTAANESALQLTLYVRTSARSLPAKLGLDFTALCESLRVQIPELKGAGIAVLPIASSQRSRRTEIPRPGPAWGTTGLLYDHIFTDDSVTPYWVPREAFFQVNRFMIEALAQIVTSGRTGQLVWDLYSGVGLFARPLADQFAQVTAVEIAEPAATALASHKLPNLRAVKATTLNFLRGALVDRDRPDLIVLDPPRTGAGPEVCALLARIAAPTLIYVSCSPETLPADLTALAASGYTVAELHLLDLFPQTTHIETVAVLTQ
jgi:23S rRNA (uracil1939-C5)-methyltransferase